MSNNIKRVESVEALANGFGQWRARVILNAEVAGRHGQPGEVKANYAAARRAARKAIAAELAARNDGTEFKLELVHAIQQGYGDRFLGTPDLYLFREV